jgi:tetratricopeptide (TPR) repeat protein
MRIWKQSLILPIALMQIGGLVPGISLAAEDTEPKRAEATEAIDLEALRVDRAKKAKKYAPSQRVKRYLAASAAAVDAGDPEEAKNLLLRLHTNRLNPYERALIFRMLAFVAYGSENAEEAVAYFEKFLAQEMLPIKDEARVRFNIAQLYASLEEWQKMVDWLDDWLLYVEEPNPLGFYLMGMAFYQLEQYDAAIEATQRAIEIGREPKESWLRLLASLHSEKQDHASATPIFEELILRFPKKQYWVQLSLIYGARVDFRRALTVQQAAYVQGLLTNDKELRRLARSYLYHDLPYPAALVLEKSLEEGSIRADAAAFELLANSWISAREYKRSRAPLLKAAELSEDGNLFVRLGQVYMQDENWSKASALLEKAVEKGGLENPGNAYLLLGISYYNGARATPARAAFKRARQHDKTKADANRWITHLDTENAESAG